MKFISKRHVAALALGAVTALAAPAAARADTVTDWNQYATDALIGTAGQMPPVAAANLAMMHGAVYDAVNAIDGRHEPYLGAPPARPWYSKDAAVATAAYRVLVAVLPAQQARFDELYARSLAAVADGRAEEGGVAVGSAAASAMLAARANDGRFGSFRWPVGFEPGQWRPTPPMFVNDPFAWIARMRPFLIDDPSRFRTAGPYPLTSAQYAEEFAEVKAFGSLTSSVRTAEQTEIARFWADHPVALWSRIFRQLSTEHRLRAADSARYFAMLYLTAIDAGISCGDDKAHWLFWRPITAIREAAGDGNPATEPDPGWLPLMVTPPFPEHPSGHTCFSGAVTRTLRDFFGTNHVRFSAHSIGSATTRSFTRFSQAIKEVIDARVYSGIHFRIADVQGARLGKKVARWREQHYFRPVRRR